MHFLECKCLYFDRYFKRSLLPRVQLIISPYCFRLWLRAKQVSSRYLNQCWSRSSMPYNVTRLQLVKTPPPLFFQALYPYFTTIKLLSWTAMFLKLCFNSKKLEGSQLMNYTRNAKIIKSCWYLYTHMECWGSGTNELVWELGPININI